MKIAVLVVVAAALISGATRSTGQAAAQSSASAAAPAGNAETGKRLFTRDGCYECHGLQGQGAQASAPRIGPDPIAFQAFTRYIRKPTGEMPPYTDKVLPDKDLADIYAFLKSLPRPPAAATIPLLN
jgi:ubiquinol-cytochrome c reductase cytochrome c subunit